MAWSAPTNGSKRRSYSTRRSRPEINTPLSSEGRTPAGWVEHFKAAAEFFSTPTRAGDWPCEWHLTEVNELARVEPQVHFKQVAPTIYENQALQHQSATDQPHLENLLPQNRAGGSEEMF